MITLSDSGDREATAEAQPRAERTATNALETVMAAEAAVLDSTRATAVTARLRGVDGTDGPDGGGLGGGGGGGRRLQRRRCRTRCQYLERERRRRRGRWRPLSGPTRDERRTSIISRVRVALQCRMASSSSTTTTGTSHPRSRSAQCGFLGSDIHWFTEGQSHDRSPSEEGVLATSLSIRTLREIRRLPVARSHPPIKSSAIVNPHWPARSANAQPRSAQLSCGVQR